jgi:parallel beta-helix repeat protein
MKTLDQVEARIPVDATHTPGDTGTEFIISQPGSYYLTSNITGVAGKDGILINSSNVTLDLNGFTLDGANGTGNTGVSIGGVVRVVVQNGTITHWKNAGLSGPIAVSLKIKNLLAENNGSGGQYPGINVSSGGAEVTDCVAKVNTGYGILTGSNAVVRGCVAQSNGQDGISAQGSATVVDCNSAANQGNGITVAGGAVTGCSATVNSVGIKSTGAGTTITQCTVDSPVTVGIQIIDGCVIDRCSVTTAPIGIQAGNGCTITGCGVRASTSAGITVGNDCVVSGTSSVGNTGTSNGITSGQGCTINGCTASSNGGNGIYVDQGCTVTNCTARGNTSTGIRLFDNSLAQKCTVFGNHGDGVTLTTACVVRDCDASGNGVGGTHDGIHLLVFGNSNRVDGNNASNNTGWGIHQESGPDLIVRNTARGNGSGNYSPSSGTSVGPIGSPDTATSPWANFQ